VKLFLVGWEAMFLSMATRPGATIGAANVFVGIYLMAWDTFTASMTVASLLTCWAVVSIFVKVSYADVEMSPVAPTSPGDPFW
jgi:succinate-acetate transporter protein